MKCGFVAKSSFSSGPERLQLTTTMPPPRNRGRRPRKMPKITIDKPESKISFPDDGKAPVKASDVIDVDVDVAQPVGASDGKKLSGAMLMPQEVSNLLMLLLR